MIWIFASVLLVLLVVSPGFRKWGLGGVCVLGVGLLLSLYPHHTPQGQTRARHATSWEQRSGTPGTRAAPPAQERPEAVSTPEEAAQTVQRFRVAHDVRRRGQEEPSTLTVPQADVRAPRDTIAPHHAPTDPAPARQSARVSEDNDSRVLAGPPTVSAPPTASATLTPRALPTLSAPPSGRALKSCDALKAEIRAKLEAKSLTSYGLTIMPSGALQGLQVVGSCEGNTKTIVLTRSRNAP